MAIEFLCECGQQFRVGDQHAGKRTKCKACGEVVMIPQKAAKKSATARKSAARPTAADDEDLFVLEPSSASGGGGEGDEFDFALEETGPSRKLPGKPGAKKKKVREDDEFEAPKAKKKKKKSSAADEGGMPKPALIAVLAVLGVVGLVGIGFVAVKMFGGGGGGQTKSLDKQYVTVRHEISSFSIDHPDDWKAAIAGGSGGAPPSIQIDGDEAYFRVKGSLGGAAIGDAAQAGSNLGSNLGINLPGEEGEDAGGGEDLAPVAVVHEMQGKFFEQDYDDYEETPGQKIDTPFGEGRISTYTAKKGMFGGKIKGFRASFLATDYNYNIYCYVPEKQFEQYEPVFRRMIGSFKR